MRHDERLEPLVVYAHTFSHKTTTATTNKYTRQSVGGGKKYTKNVKRKQFLKGKRKDKRAEMNLYLAENISPLPPPPTLLAQLPPRADPPSEITPGTPVTSHLKW